MTSVGSLCSGVGGLDLAVCAHYGADVAFHAEIDPVAALVLAARFPGVPNVGDVTVMDWAGVPPVDILTAGYPCQPFSLSGPRRGASDERHIWPWVLGAVSVLRPRRVVLENVRGHLSLGLDRVTADLAGLGYMGRWGVVRAVDAGSCHSRARVFVVAAAGDADRGGLHQISGVRQAAARVESETPGDDQRAGRAAAPRDGGVLPGPDGPQAWARDWGPHQRAMSRWAGIIGRPAPAPLTGTGQLNARFTEWQMGLADGWVTGLVPNGGAAYRVIGNGVVAQQAALALELLDPMQDGA